MLCNFPGKKGCSPAVVVILLFCLFSAGVHAQNRREHNGNFQGRNFPGSITGTVLDSSGNSPLEGAAVRISRIGSDSSRARGNYTDEKGNFTIKVPYGTYKITVTYTGYNKYIADSVEVSSSKPEASLEKIKLSMSNISTEEIEVESQKPVMEITPEKKVVNVENTIITKGETVIDLLKKIPLVQVDNNNNVMMRGSANVKLLINGKESAMTDYLDQMPAEMVQDIELITNPPAKYESEGQAGLINIVLKENANKGINGGITLSAATSDRYNGSVNFNMRKGNFTILGNLYYGTNYNTSTSSNNLVNTLNTLSYTNQNDFTENKRRFEYFNGGFEYMFSKEHSLNFQGFYGYGKTNGSDYGQNYLLDSVQSLYEYYTKNNFTDGSGKRYHLSLTYDGKYKDNEQLTGNVTLTGGSANSTLNQTLHYFDGNYIPLNISPYNEVDTRNSSNYHFNTQLDYVKPFSKESKLEAGYKGVIRSSDNNLVADTMNYNTNQYTENLGTSNHFIYKEQIYALYAEYGNAIGNFSFKLGLRGEQTFTKGDLVNTDTVFTTKYFDLFPTLNLAQKLGEVEQIQASYSRRINRPNNFRLNPFVNRANPQNIVYGNPHLKPQYTDSYELNFVTTLGTSSVTPSLFLRRTHDLMTRYVVQTDSNITVSTFQNFSSSTSYGIDLIMSTSIFKWWMLNATLSYYRLSFDGGNIDNFATPSGYSFRGNFSTIVTLPKLFDFQMFYNYQGKKFTSQGTIDPRQSLDVGISKTFFDNSLTVLLKANDIFKTLNNNSYMAGLGFIENSTGSYNSRNVQLTVTYKFGNNDKRQQRKRMNNDKNKNNEDEQNDDNIEDEGE